MALHKKLRFKLHPKHGGSTAKKACTPLVSDCAMKVPVVVLHKLNLEPDHQSSKLSVKEPDHRLCTNQDRQEVRALGKRKAHDKMALSPAAQSTLLPRSTDFTRSHDLQDFDHKTICRKQLKVLLVRTSLDTKNQLEKQATNDDDDDSDHEDDVRPTDDGSHLNVHHENQEEQSTDDSDSDQFDEQDLEELSPYERQRLKNIKHNAKFLKSINLLEAASGLCPKKKRTLVKSTLCGRMNRVIHKYYTFSKKDKPSYGNGKIEVMALGRRREKNKRKCRTSPSAEVAKELYGKPFKKRNNKTLQKVAFSSYCRTKMKTPTRPAKRIPSKAHSVK